MLMRSVMAVNKEREGNGLGIYWQAHSPCALQFAHVFIPLFHCACLLTFVQPMTVKIALPLEIHAAATERPYIIFSFTVFFPPTDLKSAVQSSTASVNLMDSKMIYKNTHTHIYTYMWDMHKCKSIVVKSRTKAVF